MKYHIIVKNEERLDKDVICMADCYDDAVQFALEQLDVNLDWLCGSMPDQTLTGGYERSVSELKQSGYTEFFDLRIFVTLLPFNQDWFALGKKVSASEGCQWRDELIVCMNDRLLSTVAKCYALLENSTPPIEQVVRQASDMWLDSTEAPLVNDVHTHGVGQVIIERERILYRLMSDADKDYWALYEIARF